VDGPPKNRMACRLGNTRRRSFPLRRSRPAFRPGKTFDLVSARLTSDRLRQLPGPSVNDAFSRGTTRRLSISTHCAHRSSVCHDCPTIFRNGGREKSASARQKKGSAFSFFALKWDDAFRRLCENCADDSSRLDADQRGVEALEFDAEGVGLMPHRCSMVAWRSWVLTTFSTER